MAIIFKLHEKLKENNLTMNKFSQIIKIRNNTISGYCKNDFKYLDKEHLDLFCKYFNCKPSDLIDFIDDDFIDYI